MLLATAASPGMVSQLGRPPNVRTAPGTHLMVLGLVSISDNSTGILPDHAAAPIMVWVHSWSLWLRQLQAITRYLLNPAEIFHHFCFPSSTSCFKHKGSLIGAARALGVYWQVRLAPIAS